MACGCNSNCNCSTPLVIPTGTNGTNGSNGMFGGWSQRFVFNGATSASPAATNLRLNNAAPASVTEIYVSDTNADSVDVDAFLDAFDNSGAYGKVKIWKQFDSNTFWMGDVTSVTDNGADHTIGVTYVAHNGTFSASDSLVLSFVADGTDGITYFTGTYATLTTLIGSLVPGGTYILTDYETKHEVPGTGITNQAASGYAGTSEQLKLTAKDASSFYHEVESLDHPEDDILYDFNLNTVLAQSRPGLIYYRKNNTDDIEAWFDVRNQTVARYALNTASFQWTSDPVDRGDVVFNAGIVYQSIRDGASLVNFRLVDDISEINQNLHGNTNASYFGQSLPYDASTISYHDAIGTVNVSHIKLGKEVNDILIDQCQHVIVGEESSKISLVSSSNIIIGTSVDQLIAQSSNGLAVGKDSSNVFVYNSQNSVFGTTVSSILLKGCLSTNIAQATTNVLLHKSNECTIGSGCNSIMFIRASDQNVVGNNCAGISLGNSVNNLFDQSCSDIDIFSGGYNRFAQGCNVIGLIGELDDAYTGAGNQDPVTPGTYYSPYSQMEHNTFGTGCSNITFEILGGRGNQFGDECKNLTFTVDDYSQDWRLVGCHFCRGIQNKTFQHIIHGTSFIVPNQVTATITSGDWYAQVIWIEDNADGGGNEGKYMAAEPIPANRIVMGYESVMNMPFFDPSLTGNIAYSGSWGSGGDITSPEMRHAQVTGMAWKWTNLGQPLAMTLIPKIGGMGDPTVSLNR